MSATDTHFDAALDTAVTALAGLRPAMEALQEIAAIQAMCPLASEIALRGLREVKDAIVMEAATDHYERQLETALADEPRLASVDVPRAERVAGAWGALAEKMTPAVERLDARVAAEQDSDRRARA
jgi:hypothetical protein